LCETEVFDVFKGKVEFIVIEKCQCYKFWCVCLK